MKILGHSVVLDFPSNSLSVTYHLISLFRLLPGLCLSKLMVIVSGAEKSTHIYRCLDELIAEGNGWKFLYFGDLLLYQLQSSFVRGCEMLTEDAH